MSIGLHRTPWDSTGLHRTRGAQSDPSNFDPGIGIYSYREAGKLLGAPCKAGGSLEDSMFIGLHRTPWDSTAWRILWGKGFSSSRGRGTENPFEEAVPASMPRESWNGKMVSRRLGVRAMAISHTL